MKKTFKKNLESQKDQEELTPTEREVLHLLANEYLTIRKVAIRRGTSVQAVYEIVKKIKQKGLMDRTFKDLEKNQGTFKDFKPLSNHSIRLHGQQFRIKILFQDERYIKTLEKANNLIIDGNTIKLNRDTVEIYSKTSFYGDDVQQATAQSIDYWNRFFIKLEHDLKVLLIKSRSQNIKLVKQHYAETNNELAEEVEKKGDLIKVYTTKEGKLWFTIDNSLNLSEAETVNPSTAQQDMRDTVRPLFNDLRDKPNYLPSEIRATVETTLNLVKEVAAAQLNQTNLMESLLPPKPIKEKSIKRERPSYVG